MTNRIISRFLGTFVAVMLLLATGMAKKETKTYPEEGKVVGTGTAEHGNRVRSHIYKVETATKVFVLDCGTRFGFSGGECGGGNKKLEVGDVIHFRLEKDWIYIPVTETVTDSDRTDHQESGEQRLRVVSQELRPAASPEKPQ